MKKHKNVHFKTKNLTFIVYIEIFIVYFYYIKKCISFIINSSD